jgi:hypothetical protein
MFRIPGSPRASEEWIAVDRLADALALLDAKLGDRVTLRQARAFLRIARSDFQGEELSIAELGRDVGGIPYRSVIERFGESGGGLIDKEDDPRDARTQIVSLTNRGRVVAQAVVEAVMEPNDVERLNKERRKRARARSNRIDRLA